jgi:hypothetical protein
VRSVRRSSTRTLSETDTGVGRREKEGRGRQGEEGSVEVEGSTEDRIQNYSFKKETESVVGLGACAPRRAMAFVCVVRLFACESAACR